MTMVRDGCYRSTNFSRYLHLPLLLLSFVTLMAATQSQCPQVDSSTMSGTEDSCPTASQLGRDRASQLQFRFYFWNSLSYMAVPLNRSTELMDHPRFNKDQCMVLYSFGWGRSSDTFDTQAIINAYLNTGNYNLIINDWAPVANLDDYSDVVALLDLMAEDVAKATDALIDAGVPLCHIAGHSVSGQLVGMIARRMRNNVPRITALDPAGQYFYPPQKCYEPLSERDAQCVTAIHTDGCNIGTLNRGGTMDIYMNGGTEQPECDQLNQSIDVGSTWPTCNHDHAVLYWAEAINNTSAFVARRCYSYQAFNQGLCNDYPTLLLGDCTDRVVGKYYLTTNSHAPYGMGESGATRN